MMLLLACAARAPLPPPQRPVDVDFSALYGGQSSASVYDPRQFSGELLTRVLVEPGALAAGPQVETWTRQLLLGHLGGLGAGVAVLHEVSIVDADGPTPITLQTTEGQRCEAIAQTWAGTPDLKPGAVAHEQAARKRLAQAFGPLGKVRPPEEPLAPDR